MQIKAGIPAAGTGSGSAPSPGEGSQHIQPFTWPKVGPRSSKKTPNFLIFSRNCPLSQLALPGTLSTVQVLQALSNLKPDFCPKSRSAPPTFWTHEPPSCPGMGSSLKSHLRLRNTHNPPRNIRCRCRAPGLCRSRSRPAP